MIPNRVVRLFNRFIRKKYMCWMCGCLLPKSKVIRRIDSITIWNVPQKRDEIKYLYTCKICNSIHNEHWKEWSRIRMLYRECNFGLKFCEFIQRLGYDNKL